MPLRAVFLMTLCLAFATPPMSALSQAKDTRGVTRSFVNQGSIAAKDVLANILESGRFEFVYGWQWYFDKRTTGQDLKFRDSTGQAMQVKIQSSTYVVTSDQGFRVRSCGKSRTLDYVANQKGDVDRATFKFYRHRKGTACRVYFARGSSKCVWAKYGYDHGRSPGSLRGGMRIPYDLTISADYCGSDLSLAAFLAEMESYRPAKESENLELIFKRR